jgi:hypothetical protein
MHVCPSTEQFARYQRVRCLFPADSLTQEEVRHHRDYPEAFERENGHAFNRDEFGKFGLEPWPAREFDRTSRAAHAAVVMLSFDSDNLLTVRRSGDAGI